MTKKRQARFELLRESSKERIESAALELFAHNGYGHTSISQIANAAGISKGLMYNYYESKEALLRAIVQKGFEMGDGMVADGQMAAPDDPVAMLRFFVETAFQQVQAHFQYVKLLSSLAFQEDVMATVRDDVERKKAEHLALGKTIFGQLGYPHPEEQALYFAATMDGVFLHYQLDPEGYPLERMQQMIIEQFCKKY